MLLAIPIKCFPNWTCQLCLCNCLYSTSLLSSLIAWDTSNVRQMNTTLAYIPCSKNFILQLLIIPSCQRKVELTPTFCWSCSTGLLNSHKRSPPSNVSLVPCQASMSLVNLNIRKSQFIQIQSFAKAIKCLLNVSYLSLFFFPNG